MADCRQSGYRGINTQQASTNNRVPILPSNQHPRSRSPTTDHQQHGTQGAQRAFSVARNDHDNKTRTMYKVKKKMSGINQSRSTGYCKEIPPKQRTPDIRFFVLVPSRRNSFMQWQRRLGWSRGRLEQPLRWSLGQLPRWLGQQRPRSRWLGRSLAPRRRWLASRW